MLACCIVHTALSQIQPERTCRGIGMHARTAELHSRARQGLQVRPGECTCSNTCRTSVAALYRYTGPLRHCLAPRLSALQRRNLPHLLEALYPGCLSAQSLDAALKESARPAALLAVAHEALSACACDVSSLQATAINCSCAHPSAPVMQSTTGLWKLPGPGRSAWVPHLHACLLGHSVGLQPRVWPMHGMH